jgi:hypothetical protein
MNNQKEIQKHKDHKLGEDSMCVTPGLVFCNTCEEPLRNGIVLDDIFHGDYIEERA